MSEYISEFVAKFCGGHQEAIRNSLENGYGGHSIHRRAVSANSTQDIGCSLNYMVTNEARQCVCAWLVNQIDDRRRHRLSEILWPRACVNVCLNASNECVY